MGQNVIDLILPFGIRIKREPAGGVSVHAGPLLFALDMAPITKKSTNCYYPPDGCNDPTIDPTVDWRTALVLDGADHKTGGLKIEWPTDDDSCFSTEPFQRSSRLPKIHAIGAKVAQKDWPTVNCTSMENHCHQCAGPVPNVSSPSAQGPVTLIPFGATDIRMAVLPALWTTGVADPFVSI